MNKTFYVTTPIYYPSGQLHIGNAYTTVFCDALKRYKKMREYDTYYLTGMDEHGKKVETVALELGRSPLEHVDAIANDTQALWSRLKINYDDFIRTTEKRHKTVVQKWFEQLIEQGDIYLGEYEGYYCMPCESFFTQTQLGEGETCPDCGRPTHKLKEDSYFLKLSKYTKKLLKHIEENPDFITPETRRNEVVSFIEQGLNDLSVSRTTFDWGIKVVSDPKHVVYVWLDALSNYISALGYDSDDPSLYEKYWLGDEILHVVGKDILRFHAIYWPIMLMALDIPVNFKLHAHGWYLMREGKMSKSKGSVIYPDLILKRYGLDALRYFLLKELPYGGDGLFSPDSFVERLNFDLANDFGNLLNRSVAMIQQYADGTVKANAASTPFDEALETHIQETQQRYEEAFNAYKISQAIQEVWTLIRRTNKYIDETAPWVLAKDSTQKETLENVLFHLAETLRIVGILLRPILIEGQEKLFRQLGVSHAHQRYETAVFGTNTHFTVASDVEPLFPRLKVEDEVAALAEMIRNQHKPSLAVPIQDEITIDDFMKCDLRIGIIKACKRHPNADKLLISSVDCGEGKERQIVSGIAAHYEPNQLVGKKVIVVANLKPVTLRGELSEGMLLAGSNAAQLEVVTVDELKPGDKVK